MAFSPLGGPMCPHKKKKKIGNKVKPRINISLIWFSHLTRPQLPEVTNTEIIYFVNANKNRNE